MEEWEKDKQTAYRLLSRLTPEKIVRMRRFRKLVYKAAELTDETGHETGFKVYATHRTRDGLAFGPVVLGSGDELYSPFRIELFEPGCLILYLHFHPDAEGAIVPSTEDLHSTLGLFPEEKFFPWAVIAQVRRNGRIDLLFIRAQYGADPEIELSEVSEARQGEINKKLEEAGFIVAFFSIKPKLKKE